MTSITATATAATDREFYPLMTIDLIEAIKHYIVDSIAFNVATDKDVLILKRGIGKVVDQLHIVHITKANDGEWYPLNVDKFTYCPNLRDISKVHTEMNKQSAAIAKAYRADIGAVAKHNGYKNRVAYPMPD